MNTEAPQTPIHLITSSEPSSNQFNHDQLKSPLNSHSDDETEFIASPLNSLFNSNMNSNNDQTVEIMLKDMIILLGDSKTNENQLNRSSIKSVLEKSLHTIAHYKLQNNILKFEANESNKRFDVENGLIKSQVDYLLKSPFKPSNESSSSVSGCSNFRIQKSIPKSKTKKLKLVEKNTNRTNRTNANNNDNKELKDYIKVFHLEK